MPHSADVCARDLAYRGSMSTDALDPEAAAGRRAGELRALDTPRDGVPPVVATPHALAAASPRFAPAPGRSPSTPSAPPATATGSARSSCSSAARAPAPCCSTRPPCPTSAPSARPSRTRSGCCTRPRRTCRAWRTSACGRAGSSTPSSAPGSPASSASASRPSSRSCSGLSLAKEHSAVDWSIRPLPEPWLRYAALDVEVLVELRDVLAAELERQGKLGWALRGVRRARRRAAPPHPAVDPWRRTSRHAPGAHPPPAGRRPGAVAGPRRARPGAGRLPGPDHPRRLDRRGGAGHAADQARR